MKIKELFKAYNELVEKTENVKSIFSEAGMEDVSAKLDFGFFPLGSGMFNNNPKVEEAEIVKCRVMVLGNDFGTLEYVRTKCPENKENEKSATHRNLRELDLDKETTFFTNFFMGLRKEGGMIDPKKVPPLYREFCYNFFKIQLNYLNPDIVLCLGKEVGLSLSLISPLNFPNFSSNIKDLYADPNKSESIKYTNDSDFGNRKFVLIPHPCFAHINWRTNNISQKIKDSLVASTI